MGRRFCYESKVIKKGRPFLCPFSSFCAAKLQRASKTTVLQEFHIHDARRKNSNFTNASSAAFAQQNCREHSFYCFTGIPHSLCSQKKLQLHKSLFRSFCIAKLPRASELTVLLEFHNHDARTPNSPQVAKSILH